MNTRKPVILFLYTELAGYFLACVNELSNQAEVHIIHWPVNTDAPFQFDFSPKVMWHERDKLTDKQLANLASEISPDIIVCSGWVDKGYKAVAKSFRNKIPVVVCVDNQWRGSAKQRIAGTLSKVTVKPYFSHAWVPGSRQLQFVTKLGFNSNVVLTGFYCADVYRFEKMYNANNQRKTENFPKRFLYVGRYANEKGVRELWQAFQEIVDETKTGWELWCLGTGDVEGPKHPQIKHFGFVQPNELDYYVAQTGVFVLPSSFEPWGVVLQEYAAAGFPLIATKEVGATTTFLDDTINGVLLADSSVSEIRSGMKQIIDETDEELVKMGKASHEISKRISPEGWVRQLLSVQS